MRLIPDPLVIEENDGYDKAVIDRSEFGGFMTNLVRNTKEPLIIALDGKWGEGKTTFVRIWQNQLECRGPWNHESARRVAALYINAFEMEANDDIFISLVAEIDAFVRNRCADTSQLDAFRKTAIQLVSKLLPVAPNAGLRKRLPNALDEDEREAITTGSNAISHCLSECVERVLESRLQAIIENKAVMREFQALLNRLPQTIRENPSGQMVVIVDELERCRPSYMVEFLEKIKHHFSTENVKFVLVINKMQLEESIRAVYGRIDAAEYLQKFIDVSASLSRNEKVVTQSDSIRYCRNLLEIHEIAKSAYSDQFVEFLGRFAIYAKLSLRQIEKIVSNFVILQMATNGKYEKRHEWFRSVTIFACIAKVLDFDLCTQVMRGTHSRKSIDQFCEKHLCGEFRDPRFAEFVNSTTFAAMTIPEFHQVYSSNLGSSILTVCGNSFEIRRQFLPSVISEICEYSN